MTDPDLEDIGPQKMHQNQHRLFCNYWEYCYKTGQCNIETNFINWQIQKLSFNMEENSKLNKTKQDQWKSNNIILQVALR
jgi:hypothetical protein